MLPCVILPTEGGFIACCSVCCTLGLRLCVAVRVAVCVAVFVADVAALEGFICVAHPDCSFIGLDSCVAVRYSVLQCAAMCCSVLQCVAVCRVGYMVNLYPTRHTAAHCNTLQHTATWYT